MAKKITPSFEEQMKRLQEIVQELERSNLPLEQNVALYKEGQTLAAACKAMLDTAKNEILLCSEHEEAPFTPDPMEELVLSPSSK